MSNSSPSFLNADLIDQGKYVFQFHLMDIIYKISRWTNNFVFHYGVTYITLDLVHDAHLELFFFSQITENSDSEIQLYQLMFQNSGHWLN